MKRKQRFISALLAWSGLAFPFLSLAMRRAHSCHFGLGPRMRRYTEWSWTRATACNRRTVAHLQTSKQEISVVTSRILGYLLYSMLSHFSRVRLFVTPWTIALQVCLTIGFSRQEYWSGLLYPPPGDLPDSGTEPTFLTSPALAGRFFTASTTWQDFRSPGKPWEGIQHYLVKLTDTLPEASVPLKFCQ